MTTDGDILDLEVTGIAHGGVMVSRHEGRVVFVADAIPGERVRARVSDATKHAFWRAETLEVLEPSPHRRPHVWREADVSRLPEQRPGGADLGHVEAGHQRTLKRRVLAEALDRFAGGGLVAPEVEDVGGAEKGWRTRLTLHVGPDGVLGPFAARSRRVVPVSGHPLARPSLAEAIAELSAAPGTRRPGRIDLVEPGDGRVRVVERPAGPSGRRGPGGGRPAARRRGDRDVSPEVVRERAGGREFGVDADGFWQVHFRAAEVLDEAVAEMLTGRIDPDAAHLDLYGGVGLFAATLARLGARRITTVESSPRATGHARENLHDIGVEAVNARVDRFLGDRRDSSGGREFSGGVVVLDPPRAGAGRAVVEEVAALRPRAVVYVACDPVALARDLGTFRALGYEPEALRAFDLFPHSHHLETVALLSSEGSGPE